MKGANNNEKPYNFLNSIIGPLPKAEKCLKTYLPYSFHVNKKWKILIFHKWIMEKLIVDAREK